MSTLRRQEPLGPGLKRLACAQIETAIRSLTRQAGQAQGAAAAMRGMGAVLALIEPELPRRAVRRDRAIVGRLNDGLDALTQPVRLRELLDRRYKKSPSDPALAGAVKAVRKRLPGKSRSGAAMNSKAGNFNPAIYRLVADMAELRGHAGEWQIDAIPSDAPPRGLRRTYLKARKLAHQPVSSETLAGLHETLPLLADQLGVMGKACPQMIKAQRKLITRAAEALDEMLLNDALDLSLRKELTGSTKALPKARPLAKRAAEAFETDLETALAETPAAFMNRMQAYWAAWHA